MFYINSDENLSPAAQRKIKDANVVERGTLGPLWHVRFISSESGHENLDHCFIADSVAEVLRLIENPLRSHVRLSVLFSTSIRASRDRQLTLTKCLSIWSVETHGKPGPEWAVETEHGVIPCDPFSLHKFGKQSIYEMSDCKWRYDATSRNPDDAFLRMISSVGHSAV